MNETTVSRIIAGAVIVFVAVLVVNKLRHPNREQITSAKTEVSQPLTQVPSSENLPAQYEIQKGDSLWSIATTAYGSGYSWTQIYQANKSVITNPSLINAGTVITLPKLAVVKTSGTYTVVRGDNLWNIALNQCGNGAQWSKIASDNNLANPRIIHAGNVFKIQCK